MPDGRVYATENGCFAKTFGLNPEDEPTIYGAVTQPDSYLENVSQNDDDVDFFDTTYTQNGRAIFPLPGHRVSRDEDIDEAHFLLILNRNENIIPAVAKLEGPQAAAYFMLGETQGTSAGGADEAGKSLRVPGTNPFFPLPHDLQGNRFLELLEEHPIEVYLMNTGRVGGAEGDERSKKVKIKHSSAIVKAIAEGTIEWEKDPDFGYLVASSVPGIDAEDMDILQPQRLYEAPGRKDEYDAVQRLKDERAEFLSEFPSLSDEIVESVTNSVSALPQSSSSSSSSWQSSSSVAFVVAVASSSSQGAATWSESVKSWSKVPLFELQNGPAGQEPVISTRVSAGVARPASVNVPAGALIVAS